MVELPRITFGMIVLNGMPFIKYNLRSIYPFAHQIIVVEGASRHAASISTLSGHSTDRTLENLYEFQEKEDPEKKICIVTAEDEGHSNGFWVGEKHEQSQAYARRATGDWLWQVDVDEFYKSSDIEYICNKFLTQQEIMTISFPQIQFWGGLNWYTDGWYLRYKGGGEFNRLFRWGEHYKYSTHRPPTVLNENGKNLREIKWIRASELLIEKIFLYHYSLVLPKQVIEKSTYYQNADWNSFNKMLEWQQNSFYKLRKPYRVHNVYTSPSWLENFTGKHPPFVYQMWQEIPEYEKRNTEDIVRLLNTFSYRFGIQILKICGPLYYFALNSIVGLFRLLPKLLQNKVKHIVYRT